MSDTAIRVENLGKRYRLGRLQRKNDTLRDALSRGAYGFIRSLESRLRGNRNDKQVDETIWALQSVSVEVSQGEVVGIIGNNGAGKSTLLKILSSITEPTTGYAAIYGRVGSLLEVGTGFHSELTGRENIYLNGAILGMRRAEINRKFEEIVDFAEVEKFIDTPVKHYSSGMYLRLAFAVAAHLEPEILLVDEVLAVGDVQFQKKCLGKMGDVAKQGRTILFVSHNLVAMEGLCERAIWLKDGMIVNDGKAPHVISDYLRKSLSSTTERLWNDIATAPGNDKVRLRRACVRPVSGSPQDPIDVRTPFVIEFEYWNLQPGAYLNLSLHVYNDQGIMVFNIGPVDEPRPFPVGLFRDIGRVPGDLMNDGIHSIELLVVQNQVNVIYRHPDILAFDIRDNPEMRGGWHGQWPGAVRPILDWSTESVEIDEAFPEKRIIYETGHERVSTS